MTRALHDARPGRELLFRVLRERDHLKGLTPGEWDALLPAAEHAKLIARTAADADALELADRLPEWVSDRLVSSRIRGQEAERAVRWEIDRIHRALLPIGVRPVFLKGAAYIALGLDCGVGRVVADVDILVPEPDLSPVQDGLKAHGWEFLPQTAYDERYYRDWMHELPPMRHRERGTVVDVHHGILPRTGRLRPSSAVLLERAVTTGQARVLCPTHMVLHAAAHLFQDGEIAGAIRDLSDMDRLLRHFSARDDRFWRMLACDAGELGVKRPAFYAVRYAHRLLGTPCPADLWVGVPGAIPPSPVLGLMDLLVSGAMTRPEDSGNLRASALYIRAHWLRMPPARLAGHLTVKWLRKLRSTDRIG